MFRSLHIAVAFSGALFFGGILGATTGSAYAAVELDPSTFAPAAQGMGEAKEAPPDPSRKKAGEACKSSDECQKHHSCVKVGDQNRCQAPPSRLPPGAVT